MGKSVYRIDDFSGGIRQDVAPENVPRNACVECVGLDVSEDIGALTRQYGWQQEAATTGMTGTPVMAFAYVVEEPSGPQEIKVIGTLDSNVPKFWTDVYFNDAGVWLDDGTWRRWVHHASRVNRFNANVDGWTGPYGTPTDYYIRDGIVRVAMKTNATQSDQTYTYPLWYGFVKKSMLWQGTAFAYPEVPNEHGYFLVGPSHLWAPQYKWRRTVGATPTDFYGLYIKPEVDSASTGYNTKAGHYRFAASYVYDGYQEGPLGFKCGGYAVGTENAAPVLTVAAGDVGDLIKVTVHVAYTNSTVEGATSNAWMDWRWSAIRLYMKFIPASVNDVETDWQLVCHIPLDDKIVGQDHGEGGIGWNDSFDAAEYSGWPTGYVTDGSGSARTHNFEVQIAGMDGLGMTYWDSAGHSHDKVNWVNYEKLAAADDQLVVGKVNDVSLPTPYLRVAGLPDAEYDPSIRYAARQGWSGAVAIDLFPPLNAVPMESGSGEIQKIESLGSSVAVLQDQALTILRATSGGFVKYEDVYSGVGCIAPDTVVRIGDSLFFMGRDGLWQYNGLRANSVSESIKDWWDGFTLDEQKAAMALYDTKDRQYWIFVISGGTMESRKYSFVRNSWVASGNYAFASFFPFTGKDENVWGAAPGYLYKISSSLLVVPCWWKSGILNMDQPEIKKRHKDIFITYDGKGYQVRLYVDGSDSYTILGTCSDVSDLTTQRFHLSSKLHKNIQIELYRQSDAINYATVNSIDVYYESRKPTSLG